jgi:4-hydroxy-3-polyprenylbenzoate decarboxylase
MSGASGQIYGIRILQVLKDLRVETHLVISQPAEKTIEHETDYKAEEVKKMADFVYDVNDVGARIASGSFKCDGMIIAPCSIKTASSIAYSINDNLITRAADVTLKQKGMVVAMVREAPLHRGHLKTLLRLSELGVVVFPPVPAFYAMPSSLGDMIDHTVGRILDFFGLEHNLYTPWNGLRE